MLCRDDLQTRRWRRRRFSWLPRCSGSMATHTPFHLAPSRSHLTRDSFVKLMSQPPRLLRRRRPCRLGTPQIFYCACTWGSVRHYQTSRSPDLASNNVSSTAPSDENHLRTCPTRCSRHVLAVQGVCRRVPIPHIFLMSIGIDRRPRVCAPRNRLRGIRPTRIPLHTCLDSIGQSTAGPQAQEGCRQGSDLW